MHSSPHPPLRRVRYPSNYLFDSGKEGLPFARGGRLVDLRAGDLEAIGYGIAARDESSMAQTGRCNFLGLLRRGFPEALAEMYRALPVSHHSPDVFAAHPPPVVSGTCGGGDANLGELRTFT